jgi:integrase
MNMAKERSGFPGGSRKHYIGTGRRPIEPAELEALLEIVRKRDPEYEVLVLLAADSGLRRAEVHAACVGHFHGQKLEVPRGKGNVSRYTVTTHRTRVALQKAMSKGITDRISPCGYSYLGMQMEEWTLRAGIAQDITWHSLRHYFAMRCLRGGVLLNELADLLGHRWLTSTAVYLHLSEDRFNRAADALESEPPPTLGSGFLKVLEGGKDY